MIASFVLLALTSPGIVFGTAYDCGPNYATFTVNACSGGVCDVSYTNPGPGQPARRVRMYRSQIATAISRGCHPAKSVQAYQNEAAQYEARAHALLAGSQPTSTVTHSTSSTVAQPRTTAGSGSLVLGKYECFTLGGSGLESAMAENVTLYSGGRFADYTGHPGTYGYSGGMVTFSGTGLSGHRAKYTPGVPHSDNPPHLTFLRDNGDDGDSCDGVG
jgi:hypothetical protein